MTDITQVILAASAGLTVVGCSVWFVVASAMGVKSRLQQNEADIAKVAGQCHGQELWMRATSDTINRIDKNVVKLAATLGVHIEQ